MKVLGRGCLLCLLLVAACGRARAAETVLLVRDGEARCCVVVGAEEAFKEPALANWAPKAALLRWAAEDIAAYIGKMSGATVRVDDKPVEGLLPIYVGCAAEGMKVEKPTEFGDAYIVDVSKERIVLHGESRRAVYYAAAHLLHELGVRWYAPGDIGEVVPQRKTIGVQVGRTQSAPDYVTRNIWMYGPEQERWSYRNRMGHPAPTIPCGHSLHSYAAKLPGWKEGKEGRAKHPQYYNSAGEQSGWWPNFAHPEVVPDYSQFVKLN
jgi:hypothetical protein